MKKSILILAFLFTAFTGFSQNSNPEAKAKAVQIIELTSGAQFDVILKPVVNSIPEANREAFKAEVRQSLTGLYDQIADLFVEKFTAKEIDEMLAFYHSPVGKKMLEQTPEITEKSMQLGQAWGMQLQPLMAKYQNTSATAPVSGTVQE